MIKKQKLLQELNKLVEAKKNFIPLVNRHISSSLFFSNISKNKYQEMIERFQAIAIQQSRHVELLEEIQKEVDGEDQNHVF